MKSLDQIRSELTSMGIQNFIYEKDGIITLSEIRIDKANRGKGLGTIAMNMLIKYADNTNQTILLSPSTDFGASSVGRLEKFYSRFGFVKNKGRNKDYRYSYTMYRKPKSESINEIKFVDFYQELLKESTDASYGYWIGKSGEVLPVKERMGHENVAEKYVKEKFGSSFKLKDYSFGEILVRSGFCRLALSLANNTLFVDNPIVSVYSNISRKQREFVNDLSNEKNLNIVYNGRQLSGELNESTDYENSELNSLYKKSDEIYKKLEMARKSPRYYDSPEYSELRKEFQRVHDRIETLQDEAEPESDSSLESGNGLIDFDYIEKLYEKDRNNYLLRRLLNNKTKKWAVDYINLRNEVLKKIINYTKSIPNANIEFQKKLLVTGEGDEDVKTSVDSFFPVVVEVSASKDDDMTISLSLESDGRFSGIFEGNDEASPETVKLVNKLINPSGKMVKVYGTHGRDVVRKIKETGTVPADIYLSPDREYSKGYQDLEGNRETFVGYVNSNSLNQESEVDWKTIEPTEIKNFRYL